ncbi:MAG: bifunctional hydroxymethylpyrimidine kinase/phosphomethylpyrimidine kinase [Myxococcales bacterium]|jgi:hydroxymethylpyrimidine/phosphomethylpyrimidine kinase|nr:bifunctional hydroxymethylpyrimidine kinase/phosphomethylpyrimidine kinase [Myxococcales bacterium]
MRPSSPPEPPPAPARVLAVGGSDPSGGAGIQADLKTLTALGVFGATAVTAITVQNTCGVTEVMPIPASVVGAQMDAVLDDIGADVIKTGMLHNIDVVRAVAARVGRAALVVDPVILASDGRELLSRDGVRALLEELVPRAALVTPNVPEAEHLTGVPIQDLEGAGRAAERLLALGAAAVLVKGGHLPGSEEEVTDLLRTVDGEEYRFSGPRIVTRAGHGTGCTLASAIAAGVAEGLTLRDAVQRGRDYLVAALRRAPILGRGSGPLWHPNADPEGAGGEPSGDPRAQ